ncbi:ABC transporter substrate-binding protein [Alloalcanivorax sp. C16-2]|uniref:ABC transporter substrate-binding protein n=1 Tax=Alloalcanivorax sp. C16-2 TaxID=3390052 RepID=UPI003970C458
MNDDARKGVLPGLVGAVMAVCIAWAGPVMADDSYSLRLNWKMKGEFTPFVVADKKGFFSEQGLGVAVKEGSGATLALQSVATGEDDFAYVPSVQLIQAVNSGMPVKAVATVYKVDPMGMVARPGVTLDTPKDLEGKKVEIAASSTFNNVWQAFAKANDIDVSKVDVVSVSPGARFGLLLSGQVDVLADIFLTNELPVLRERGSGEMDSLTVGDFGFGIIGYTLVTSEKMIETNPDAVRKFLAGAARGFQFMIDNADEAAQLAIDSHSSELLPAPTRGQVQTTIEFLAKGEPKALFVGSDEGWRSTLAILKGAGVIDREKAPSAYYTNEFIIGNE